MSNWHDRNDRNREHEHELRRHDIDPMDAVFVKQLAAHVTVIKAKPVVLTSLASDAESFLAGQIARSMEVALLANPYPRGVWDWHNWRSGWMDVDNSLRSGR